MTDFIARQLSGWPYWVSTLLGALLAAAIAVSLALVAHALLFRLLSRLGEAGGHLHHDAGTKTDSLVIRRLARPTRWAFIALALVLAARETPALAAIWSRLSGFVMPLVVGWMAATVLRALVEAMMVRSDISVADNRNARRRRTRLAIFRRIGTFLIVFLTVSGMLASIPGVREIGVTLMASAGLAALAVGAAAQPALKALIAGFQMALTEPISIDDVVILDGEWGRIEDIRTTYVIVRLWDDRRLVVPSNRFLEDTFQNWTRQSSEITGTVMLYLDPTAPIPPLRAEFERFIAGHPLWDQRAQVTQVTDMTDEAIELRLLMTARDAGRLFDLRCAVREHMLGWIAAEMPDALPRRRTQALGAPTVPEATPASGQGG